jgi:hypothetical protein
MAAPAVTTTAHAGVLLWHKRRALLWLLALAIAGPLALALLVVALIAPNAGDSQLGRFRPSALALRDIPPAYLSAYEAAGRHYGLGWEYLAAIGKIETDHGRSTAVGVSNGVNAAGCCAGPMQFSIAGSPSTWDRYGVDGNRDARTDCRPAARRRTGTARCSPTTTPAGTSPTSSSRPSCTAAHPYRAASQAPATPTRRRSPATRTSRGRSRSRNSPICAPAGCRRD